MVAVSMLDLHFADPDGPPRRLRDLLAERVRAVPAGGCIDWVTYYFRDRRLAADLVEARRRGVYVRVVLEGFPRTLRANEAVIRLLSEPLGPGLRVVTSAMDRWPRNKLWRARVHEKLYCFSHPTPTAWIGSFNPSGDEPETDPDVIREIGDQDRGYNLLAEIRDATLAEALRDHARRLHGMHHGFWGRLAPGANRVLRGPDIEIHFTPRLRRAPLLALLDEVGGDTTVRIAASHLSGRWATQALLRLAARGARIRIVAEATERRVPADMERRLREAGIEIRRAEHPGGAPMHDKFALIDSAGTRRVVFGSFNWSQPSLQYNREISAISSDARAFDAFARRWERLWAATGAHAVS